MNLRITDVSLVAAAIASLGLSAPAWSAEPLAYSAAAASLSGIGNQLPGGTFDQLSLGATSGTIAGSGTYSLNPVTFTVGGNTNTIAPYSVTGSIIDKLTIGGVTENISIGFTETVDALESVTCSPFCEINYGDQIVLNSAKATFSPYVSVAISGVTLSAFSGSEKVALQASIVNTTPVPVVAAPELDATSAVGGLSLLIGGLLVLRGRRRIEAQPA